MSAADMRRVLDADVARLDAYASEVAQLRVEHARFKAALDEIQAVKGEPVSAGIAWKATVGLE